jgi:hypothetical protein
VNAAATGGELPALRLAGVAGVLSIALGVTGVLVDRMWTFPTTGASASAIADFTHAHRTALLIAMVLSTGTVGLWLVFGIGVWLRLHETAASDERALPACFLAGLVSFVTILLAGFTCFLVLIERPPGGDGPRLLYDLSFGLLAMSGVPTALALGAYAAQVLRGRGPLPRWTAWVAAAAACAHLVLLASFAVTSGFFSLAGGVTIAIPGTLFAWVVGTSVVLLREAPARRAA